MLEILDALIATAAVVLGLSLIVQAVQQIIKQLLSMKSSYMERELVMMFLPDETLKNLSEKWGTFKRKIIPDWKLFREISSEDREIVDELKLKLQSIGYKDLEVLEQMGAGQFRAIIRELPLFAGQDPGAEGPLRKALDDVNAWFDATKQAFQDHYERKMKVWALCLSALVVIAVNANLFEVYRELSTNKALRDAAITMGQQLTSVPRDSIVVRLTASKVDTTKIVKSDSIIRREIEKNITDIQSLLHNNTFQVFRWNKAVSHNVFYETSFTGWIKRILGWFAMALLVSLGAPFWYDLLKTLMGVKDKLKASKGTGAPPQSSSNSGNESTDIPPVG